MILRENLSDPGDNIRFSIHAKRKKRDKPIPNRHVYVTTCAINNSCYFKKDFSYYVNAHYKCLFCEFCYAKMSQAEKTKLYQAGFLDLEVNNVEYKMLNIPFTIGRYFEPSKCPINTLKFIKSVLSIGGQIIYKAKRIIPDEVLEFMSDYKNDALIHLRIYGNDTYTANTMYDLFSKNIIRPKEAYEYAEKLVKLGFNIAFDFDPYIIGLNNNDLISVSKRGIDIGVNKIVIKQLFCTDKFKVFLESNGLSSCTRLLTEQVGKYETYNNYTYLKSLSDVIDKIDKSIYLGICSNREINDIISNHSNCCLFDNPNGQYDIDTKSRNKIKLFNDKVIELGKVI